MSVKFNETQMLQMEEIIKEFFLKNKIEMIIPVDIFKVASILGFDVRGAEFKEPLEGLLLVDETTEKIPGFSSNKIIAYNCQKNINMKKFIVAHELAHYINAKNISSDEKIVLATRDLEGDYSNNVDEQRMDYMAASIIMPREDLVKNYNNKSIDQAELINLVATRYNVSNKMAERRIGEVLND